MSALSYGIFNAEKELFYALFTQFPGANNTPTLLDSAACLEKAELLPSRETICFTIGLYAHTEREREKATTDIFYIFNFSVKDIKAFT